MPKDSEEGKIPEKTTIKSAYEVVAKKDNINKAHIVVVDGKKYCVHGKEYLSDNDKGIITDVPDSVLAVLHSQGYSFVKKLNNA